ncbi:opacity protein-like surface antigen [Elusimicrobium posterum]|uniref:porin family protein n=1 Tax=Elusimicrobium posterum TaxID=3116653 RepID=UPI003C73EC83
MKKILLLLALFVSVNVYAGIDYGLETGMTKIGIYGGASMPVTDWEDGSTDYKPGDTGYMFGAEIIRNFNPVFAMGVDVGYMNHGGKEVGSTGTEVKSNVLSAHVMGRINFFAEQATRIYIPFGAGLSRFEAEAVPGGSEDESGFSFVGGVGVEFDLSPVWTMGMEGRYFYMPIDDDKFGNDSFDSFNIMLKLGARF